MKNKRVLITGAAGFIGSHLVDYLLSQNFTVFGLDNFSTGLTSNVARIQQKHYREWECLNEDIREAARMEALFKELKPDIVIHLAAKVSVPDSIKDPRSTYNTNVSGFFNVILAAKEAKVKRFIYASSSAVYGEQEVFPIPETAPLDPLSFYGLSKKINEEYAELFSTPDFECIGLRFFNIFGPYQDPNNPYAAVISKWTHLLKQNKPIVIFGDGSATRDYCHIHNVTEAIHQLCTARLKEHYSIYNIGSGEATTLNELSQLLAQLLKQDPKNITYAPWREGDIHHSVADITQAKQDWNYQVLLDLRAGLADFLTVF
jgi:UDP-N-acetylglucosamine/UDP-N-acetylgalactosamine 4-epimerase